MSSEGPAGPGRPRRRAHGADRPVQALPDLRGHRVHGVDDRGRARVRRPRLRLLLLGEHQGAQAEDLVDLGAVEQVRRALRSQLRVVGEDDRAREQQVRAPLRPGEHRPGVPVVQLAGRGEGPLGRVGGREERARGDGDQGVRGDERRPQRDLARGAVGAGGVVDDVDAQPQDVVGPGQRLGGDDEPPVQRQAAPLDAAAGDGLDWCAPRGARRARCARPARRRGSRRRPPVGRPPPRGSAGRRRRPARRRGGRRCRGRTGRAAAGTAVAGAGRRRGGVRAGPRCGSGPARRGTRAG